MDFTLSEAEVELAALTRRIATDLATPERLRTVEDLDRTLWTRLAETGVLAAALPEPVGGAGLGLLAQCAVLVELGRTVAPVPYLASIVTGAAAVAEFGTAGQRVRWAEPAARGALVLTAALAEADGEPTTTAEPVDGGWRLTGTKSAVPAGTYADWILVPASTVDGGAVFVLSPDDDGVTVTAQEVVDGGREAHLELDAVTVPADRVLDGPDVTAWITDRATVGLCALQARGDRAGARTDRRLRRYP